MKIFFACFILIFIFGFTYRGYAQESQQYELTKIEFKGNRSFSSAELGDIIASQESPAWFWKFINSFSGFGKPPVFFDSLETETDTRALRDFYVSNGFFSAVAASEYVIDTVNRRVTLRYTIAEGLQSRYGNTRLFGLESIDDYYKIEITKLLDIDTTKHFSQGHIKTSIDGIVTYLENSGFMSIRYDSAIVIQDTALTQANLELYFSVGKRYYISGVQIENRGEGAKYVDSLLLRDIVGIKNGEPYNLEKLRLSQVRLYRTGLFSSVTLGPKTEDTLGNSVPISLNGNIGLMNEFAPEFIVNNQQNTFNVGLAGTFTRKNFFGSARKLTLTGSFGIRDVFKSNFSNIIKMFSLFDTTAFGYVEGLMRIEQPYVFNRPIFGIFEGYYKTNKDIVSNKRSLGGKLSFEFELPSYTFVNFLTAYYNIEEVKEVFNQRGSSTSISDASWIFGGEAKCYKADDPVFPTKGYNLTVMIEEANLFKLLFNRLLGLDFNGTLFYKFSITTSAYLKLAPRSNQVLAFKYKTGYLQSYYGDESLIPTIRKFTSGGSNSLRGWKARELAPTQDQLVNNKFVSIKGGRFLAEGSIEYRYRMTNEIGVVAFLDLGNCWLGHNEFRFDGVAVNTGFGLRYYSPFAPFRIDFGMKLFNPDSPGSLFKKPFFRDIFEFQFGIGEAF